MAAVRILAIQNLQNDGKHLSIFETQLSELKKNEKAEKVVELLNQLKF
jgi:glutaminyl-tRNA synthetase